MRFLTPRWLLYHLFVVAMVVLMVNLAFWQLRRLDERKDTNDEIRAAIERAPVEIDTVLDDPASVVDHTAVIATGTYRPELEFLVANRTFESRPGSWLVTPVELSDGRLVAVSRGWVSRLWVAGVDTSEVSTPSGSVAITGRVFATVDGGRIADVDTGDVPEVSRMDLDRVEEMLDVDVVDLWVQLDSQVPAAGELPVPVPPPGLDEGPHLSYAFQWFFFSTGTVVAYFLILRHRSRDKRRQATTSGSSPETLALLATRLRGRGTAAEVRRSAAGLAGRVDPDLDDAVDTAVTESLIRVRGEELRHSLTTAGTGRLDELLAAEASETGHAVLAGAYEAFLARNQRFLEAISSRQLDDDPSAPDRIAEVIAEVAPSLDDLGAAVPRFAGYRSRLESALSQAGDDPRWFDSPSIDSVHTVWFELHEHLLASLGRERAEERAG